MNVTCVFCVCVYLFSLLFECVCLCIICFYLPVFMYVYILSYFVNKLEIWWLYLSPIEKRYVGHQVTFKIEYLHTVHTEHSYSVLFLCPHKLSFVISSAQVYATHFVYKSHCYHRYRCYHLVIFTVN